MGSCIIRGTIFKTRTFGLILRSREARGDLQGFLLGALEVAERGRNSVVGDAARSCVIELPLVLGVRHGDGEACVYVSVCERERERERIMKKKKKKKKKKN